MAASAVGRYGIPWGQAFESGDDYSQCVKYLKENTGSYSIPPPKTARPLRRRAFAQRVRLSTATIVVCPPNLFEHWRWEIAKHTEPGSLKVLEMNDSKRAIPGIEELLTYDLLLFSRQRFDAEERIGEMNYRGAAAYTTPLSYIHWKRIIVDEVGCSSGGFLLNKTWLILPPRVIPWAIEGQPLGGCPVTY